MSTQPSISPEFINRVPTLWWGVFTCVRWQVWSHMASDTPQLWDWVPLIALLFLTVSFLFVFSWQIVINDVCCVCCRVRWLVEVISAGLVRLCQPAYTLCDVVGTLPAAWDADHLIRKSYRHSTVDQHLLVWHRHSAKYLLPEMPTVRSASPTDIPRWISVCLCDIGTRRSTCCLRCRPSDPQVLQTFHGGSAFACVTSALGKVPAAWDADRLIHKFYRHSMVDQHLLVWHRHSAKYLLSETPTVRSTSSTDILWRISVCLCDIGTRQSTCCLRCRPSNPQVLQIFHGGSASTYVTSALGIVPAAWDVAHLIRKSMVDQRPHEDVATVPMPESLSGSQSTCRYICSMSWIFIVVFYKFHSMYNLKVVFCELQCMCNVKLVMCTSCKTCAAHWPAQQCLLCSPICHRDVYPCHDMDVQ